MHVRGYTLLVVRTSAREPSLQRVRWWMDDHEAHRESFDLETINPFGPGHSIEESFKTQAELEAGKAAFLERWKGAPPYDGFPEECLQLLHRPADPRSQCHSEPAAA